MKRLIIVVGILAIVICIAYQFRFADRRSKLKVDIHKGVTSFSQFKKVSHSLSSTRLLVRDGFISIEVSNVIKSRDSIGMIAQQLGGYISDELTQDNESSLRIEATIRVPSASLDELVKRIEGTAGKVFSKRASAIDVTEEYVDLESRLVTKRKLESRYQEIIRNAQTIKELMEVEAQINAVRLEIESMETRIKYLDNQISLATLDLVIQEKDTPVTSFSQDLAKALANGWSGVLILVTLLATIWPLLIVTSLAVWLYVRFKHKLAGNAG